MILPRVRVDEVWISFTSEHKSVVVVDVTIHTFVMPHMNEIGRTEYSKSVVILVCGTESYEVYQELEMTTDFPTGKSLKSDGHHVLLKEPTGYLEE